MKAGGVGEGGMVDPSVELSVEFRIQQELRLESGHSGLWIVSM
jgi:hypothetical protein